MLGKCSTAELNPQPLLRLFFNFLALGGVGQAERLAVLRLSLALMWWSCSPSSVSITESYSIAQQLPTVRCVSEAFHHKETTGTADSYYEKDKHSSPLSFSLFMLRVT